VMLIPGHTARSCQFFAQGRRTFREAENLAKRTPIKRIALGKVLGHEAFP